MNAVGNGVALVLLLPLLVDLGRRPVELELLPVLGDVLKGEVFLAEFVLLDHQGRNASHGKIGHVRVLGHLHVQQAVVHEVVLSEELGVLLEHFLQLQLRHWVDRHGLLQVQEVQVFQHLQPTFLFLILS